MNKEIIILGGGLSGLSACYHGQGTIYEKNIKPGGQASSSEEYGFIFDEGIHVMHTKNEYILNLMEKLEVNMEIRERNAWIVSHGSMTRYPFQANTFGLPEGIVRDCVDGFIENKFIDSDTINNYEDWVYYMFGKGIAEHFMIPYSQKFWGIDAKNLTTDWVNVRHPKPSKEEVIKGSLEDQTKGFGINASYRYPKKGGYGYIGKRLTDKCKGRIKVGMEATKINVNKKEIEFNHSELVSYDNILSSIPLPELIKIIPDAPEVVINAAAKLKTNSMFVVNIGVNRPNITDKNWIYYLEKEFSFVRVSFPFNQSDNVAPVGTSSISAEIAYGNDNPLPAHKENLADLVVEDLISANVINASDEIIYIDTVDIKYAYVIFDNERKAAIKIIHEYLKKFDIIPFGRYGMWAYLWSDEAMLSGKKVAEKFSKNKDFELT
jgi:UDP-galactopyranose mutase